MRAVDACHEPAAAEVELEVDRLVVGGRPVTADDLRRTLHVGRQLLRAIELRDGHRGTLAGAGRVVDGHVVESIRRDDDRPRGCRPDLSTELRQPGERRRSRQRLHIASRKRSRLEFEVRDQIRRHPAGGFGVECAGDALRLLNRDRRQPPCEGERLERVRRAGWDPGRDQAGAVERECADADQGEAGAAQADRGCEALQERPRGADDHECAEHGDLAPELGVRRRNQDHREQADDHRVDDLGRPARGNRPRVGDHEEEEDEDLRRGDEHPPEVRAGDRPDVPARRHRVSGHRKDCERACK